MVEFGWQYGCTSGTIIIDQGSINVEDPKVSKVVFISYTI
jgi:hypothetical protein